MLVFYAVLFALGACLLAIKYFNSDLYKVRKALAAAPRVSIASLAEGRTVKVAGWVRVRDGKKLVAPLSARDCVSYEVVVEEKVGGGKNAYWREVIREDEHVDFDVEDDTGVVHVLTGDMKQVASVDSHHQSGFFRDATPELEAYLARHGTTSKGSWVNKTMRFREGVFAVGERVAVLGTVAMEDDPAGSPGEASYRGTPRRPCLQAPADGPLLASDESRSTGDD